MAAKDLRGILHAHTTASDGADTLEDMAEATLARGYAYLGVTDHSQSAHYAGGLKLDAIEAPARGDRPTECRSTRARSAS